MKPALIWAFAKYFGGWYPHGFQIRSEYEREKKVTVKVMDRLINLVGGDYFMMYTYIKTS